MTHRKQPALSAAMKLCCVRTLRFTLIAAPALTFAACGDEVAHDTESPPAPVTAQSESLNTLAWLKQTHPIAPEHWLASREAGHNIDLYDPSVVDMRRVLETAAMRFRDHPRMIANRAVQLEAMLKEKGIEESAPRIITNLSQVPGRTRYVESFASLTQQYFNLRMEGRSRGQAIDLLKAQDVGRP
jgi:hypothetical protein